MAFLPLEKSTKIGLYLKCIPLKGSCCSGKSDSSCNSRLSHDQRMICFAVVFHFIFQKYSFL